MWGNLTRQCPSFLYNIARYIVKWLYNLIGEYFQNYLLCSTASKMASIIHCICYKQGLMIQHAPDISRSLFSNAWWHHQMETFSALLALCVGNSPVTGEFPTRRPVTQSFDVFFDLRVNKRLSKQSWGWWFEMPSHPLWHHCNDLMKDTNSSPVRARYGHLLWVPSGTEVVPLKLFGCV